MNEFENKDFEKVTEMSLHKRQLMLGRTAMMVRAGKTTKEICEELKLSESTVRAFMRTVKEDDKIRNNRDSVKEEVNEK